MKRNLLVLMLLVLMLLIAIGATGADKNAPPRPSSGDASLPLPSSGDVTLPLGEYNRLVELASRPIKKPDAPPLPYSIKRADLKLQVGNESVTGNIQLQGEVFTKGMTKVPLTNGITIFDARQEGRGLPLEQQGGTHVAILPGPAEFSVTLDAGLHLVQEAGRASFNLPVPSAGSVRLTLVIPGDHTNVRINPGIITSRTSEKGQTAIEATLIPGQPANVWWTTREIAAPTVPREVRFLSDLKTLVSVSEADIKIATLADISVVQGDPTQFEVELPQGYELTGATGGSLESSEVQSGVLILKVSAPAQRSHQFLISMEKSINTSKADAPFLGFKNTQRETGEMLVEGAGTMELTATEGGGLKRMDLKEVNPYLHSLARFPLQAAFRYHKQPTETPRLALEWVRFPDSSVLAAVAERAVVTTLVTSEGKSLTEVTMTIKNQAQPFLKVDLPAGAILSADVAGEKVKPVQGPDGSRVPLLRPGFRPTDSYTISFVFMHSGAPFAKKGDSQLSLPKMDIPISFMQWEVFLPEQYKVRDFGGDALAANLLPPSFQNTKGGLDALENRGLDIMALYSPGVASAPTNTFSGTNLSTFAGTPAPSPLLPGQLGGVVTDSQGAVVPGAKVTVTSSTTGIKKMATTDASGRWFVANMPPGEVKVEIASQGFKTAVGRYDRDAT
ncbi:MAG TPA: carboxypeptidase-like regulatory domain-containing protein, partial [Candidatus Angelobacter sp.]|nr:carboxypeptidase-like regulatory domain-containing protein [Candidatus Angelobacter sp.]